MARQLYRLMAIKDEYEVARLHSSEAFQKQLAKTFSGDYSLRFHLAPPLLSKPDPETGKVRKREYGAWMMSAFRLLARFKSLRGTRLDVFALTEERKRERADLDQYLKLLDEIEARVNEKTYPPAVALANLPETLRGYGHVKDRNRENLLEPREQLLRELRGELRFVEVGGKAAA